MDQLGIGLNTEIRISLVNQLPCIAILTNNMYFEVKY